MPGSDVTSTGTGTGAITTAPLTPERWADFEALMGAKGGTGGCWCMLWRQTKAEHDKNAGKANRAAMQAIVERGEAPGLLAYDGDQPVGWISVAPRASFPRLESSRVLRPIDDQEVWSVSCFLIAKSHRRQGLATRLLEAACGFVAGHGGRIIEGYPIVANRPDYPDVYAWIGFDSLFKRAGFIEVARTSTKRRIMRKLLALDDDG
jgi:GNAT superfamily N-acetyltransferase